MQPRLTRTSRDKMFAGVCSGLGAYFNLDPVIVRLIFALVTITSFVGLPIYLLLAIIMPAESKQPTGQAPPTGDPFASARVRIEQAAEQMEDVFARGRGGRRPPPAPSDYRYDPMTGAPLDPHRSSTGKTVNLGSIGANPLAQPTPVVPPRRAKTLGIALVGIGGLILLDQIGLSIGFFFPFVLIGVGIYLLNRSRQQP